MGCASSAEEILPEPLGIAEFRKVNVPEDYQFLIPEKYNKRRLTDSPFLITLGICCIILFALMGYSLFHSDINKVYHGMDSCGNICGQRNSPINGMPCSGYDMTSRPYFSTSKECVTNCYQNDLISKYVTNQFNNRLFSSSIFYYRCLANGESNAWLESANGYVTFFCFLGLALTVGVMVLFRFYTSLVVWILLVIPLLICCAGAGTSWYFYAHPENDGTKSDALSLGISLTIFSFILALVLLLIIPKINIFIALIKEAMKVIFGIPLLLGVPLLTLLVAIVTIVTYVYLIVIFIIGSPLENIEDMHSDQPNNAIVISIVFHTIMFLWMWEFIMGCQYMVISGSVSTYFFTRNKKNINSPIYHSFYTLIRYHLGTVAFGSLIITTILIIKAIIRSMSSYKPLRCLLLCILNYVDALIRYITKFAYIQTAMHGQPFCDSGVRATRLLAANILSAVALNSVSGMVLFMAQIFIIAVTTGFGYLILWSTDHYSILQPLLVTAIVTGAIAYCFCCVLQTAIDTLFISCCEDNAINDGEINPYYRSIELDQSIKKAQRSYEK